MKILFFVSFFIGLFSSVFAETSMFGAGDLTAPNPYGLTKTEEVIVENKKIVAKNEKILKKTNSQVQNLNERIDGIESLLEGESIKLNNLSKSVAKSDEELKVYQEITKKEILKNSEDISVIKKDLLVDMKKMQLQIDENQKNIKTLKGSFDKIVSLVNKINADYVTQKDFDKLIALLKEKEKEEAQRAAKLEAQIKAVQQKKEKVVEKEVQPVVTQKQEEKKVVEKKAEPAPAPKSSRELLEEGRALFKKDYFTKAIVIFEELIKRNYKPAESNFYLGEMNYYRKNYKDALHYFKNSMTLYDKASYLPRLLLHSAISFEKIGDKNNARNFYSTIVDLYPGTDEAKEASKKMK